MTIQYLGHSAFKIKGKDVTLLLDPYGDDIGRHFPKQNDIDIVLCSHDHFDHHNLDAVANEYFLIDGPGEYDVKNISVDGIPSFHDKKKGAERGGNTIYVIDIDGVSLCHLGDLGDVLTEEQIERIGKVGILFIPVGGKYTIDAADAVTVISQIEPAIVIPMHYGNEKLGIENVDVFIKEMGVDAEHIKMLKLTKEDISDESEGSKIYIMES